MAGKGFEEAKMLAGSDNTGVVVDKSHTAADLDAQEVETSAEHGSRDAVKDMGEAGGSPSHTAADLEV